MGKRKIQFDILTLFPQMFEGFLKTSLLARAQKLGLVKVKLHDLRKWGLGSYKQVDDVPYGGGPGMVMRVDVIDAAISNIKNQISKLNKRGDRTISTSKTIKTILLTPQGKQFNQKMAKSLSKDSNLVLICGHYEGFDERIRKLVDLEISIGDYLLTGGEIPAMVLIDSISRLIPQVVGKKESLKEESFVYQNLLEYPQYTRPFEYLPQSKAFKRPLKVPAILLSGHHQKIKQWRFQQALKKTQKRRPDLLKEKRVEL